MIDVFTFNVDAELSKGGDDEERLIQGLASCEYRDAQGEIILQKGVNCAPALERGFINWDHMPGPENLIGVPTFCEVADAASHPIMAKSGIQGLGLFVRGKLLKGQPRADAAWALMKSLKGTGRSLSWSVQGKVTDYDKSNKVVRKSELRHLALTFQPVMPISFAEVVKSLYTTSGNPYTLSNQNPVMTENLDLGITAVLWGHCEDHHFDETGKFAKGRAGMLEHFVICKHMSIEQGKELVKRLALSGVGR